MSEGLSNFEGGGRTHGPPPSVYGLGYTKLCLNANIFPSKKNAQNSKFQKINRLSIMESFLNEPFKISFLFYPRRSNNHDFI